MVFNEVYEYEIEKVAEMENLLGESLIRYEVKILYSNSDGQSSEIIKSISSYNTHPSSIIQELQQEELEGESYYEYASK